MDKITISIPVYNAELFISNTILSILNQSYSNIEILIIDDRGSDNSINIINKIIEEHPRGKDILIITHESNRGVGAARNTAIKYATGKYIFFMDNDDLITPNCIELLYSKMKETPVDFIAASYKRKDLKGNIYPGITFKDRLIDGDNYPVGMYKYDKGGDIFVMSWNKLYNLNFIRKHNIKCIDNHLNEDPWFTYQVILCARSCRLISECTLFYTINPKSVTEINKKGYSNRICKQYTEIQMLKCDYISKESNSIIYPSLLFDIMFMSFYHAYRMIITDKNSTEYKKRKLLIYSILSRRFKLPNRIHFEYSYLKFISIYLIFSLPVSIKYQIIYLCKQIKLRSLIQKWIHF